jgi:hypothetical protein
VLGLNEGSKYGESAAAVQRAEALKPGPSEPVLSHALSTDPVPLPDEQQGLRAVALLFNTRLRAWSDDTAQPPDVPASPGRSACAAHNGLCVIGVMAFVEQGTAALWAAADADTLYALCDFGVLGDAQVIRLPSGSGLLCSAAWFILCAACERCATRFVWHVACGMVHASRAARSTLHCVRHASCGTLHVCVSLGSSSRSCANSCRRCRRCASARPSCGTHSCRACTAWTNRPPGCSSRRRSSSASP